MSHHTITEIACVKGAVCRYFVLKSNALLRGLRTDPINARIAIVVIILLILRE